MYVEQRKRGSENLESIAFCLQLLICSLPLRALHFLFVPYFSYAGRSSIHCSSSTPKWCFAATGLYLHASSPRRSMRFLGASENLGSMAWTPCYASERTPPPRNRSCAPPQARISRGFLFINLQYFPLLLTFSKSIKHENFG